MNICKIKPIVFSVKHFKLLHLFFVNCLLTLCSIAQQKTEAIPDATISFGKSNERPGATYTTGTTVYEEVLDKGQLIGLYWSAGGYVQRENVTAEMPENKNFLNNSFELEIDGQSLQTGWKWTRAYQRKGERNTLEAVVELTHEYRPVIIKIVTRLDGSPILVRYLEITNTGKAPASLSKVCSISGLLWNFNPESEDVQQIPDYTLGYFGGIQWGQEGRFSWEKLPQETFRIDRNLRPQQFASPYYIVRNNFNGEMFFIGLACSGRYFSEFRNVRDKGKLYFTGGPVAYGSLRVIDPGETVKSPETHMGPIHATLDKGVAAWYKHMYGSVIPPRPKGKEMYTIAGRVVEKPGDWMLREIDIAAEMGVEAFMVDAGWYGNHFAEWPENRGDWNEGSWLPGGIAGLRDYAHKKKLLFGLWHEAEAIVNTSSTYKAHPEWSTFNDTKDMGALNLAKPEALKYFQDNILHIMRDFKVDFYKLDYNVEFPDRTSVNLRESPSGKLIENESWRHYEAVYSLFDKILKEYPDVCLENCASGGGRNDLGMLSRFHYSCESDISSFPHSICAINSMSLFIPPSAICYYHNHNVYAHQLADINTHLRVTLFAVPVFVGFGSQAADRNTGYFKEIKRYIELNKTFCRRVMGNSPVVYHHTPDAAVNNGAPWCVLEYARQDRTSGYAGIFKLKNDMNDNEYLFKPRGIDISKSYKVSLDNDGQSVVVAGWELSQTGIKVHLDASKTSELILYEAKP
jgi:alpha-galactosidase